MKWWVYVLLSHTGRTYVGSTTDPHRRVRQHNGEIRGGAKSTRSGRPWRLVKVYGSYSGRSEGLRAELSLKRGKRGRGRLAWSEKDSTWYRECSESVGFTQKIVEENVTETCPPCEK